MVRQPDEFQNRPSSYLSFQSFCNNGSVALAFDSNGISGIIFEKICHLCHFSKCTPNCHSIWMHWLSDNNVLAFRYTNPAILSVDIAAEMNMHQLRGCNVVDGRRFTAILAQSSQHTGTEIDEILRST